MVLVQSTIDSTIVFLTRLFFLQSKPTKIGHIQVRVQANVAESFVRGSGFLLTMKGGKGVTYCCC